jgi:hypothetical protein
LVHRAKIKILKKVSLLTGKNLALAKIRARFLPQSKLLEKSSISPGKRSLERVLRISVQSLESPTKRTLKRVLRISVQSLESPTKRSLERVLRISVQSLASLILLSHLLLPRS